MARKRAVNTSESHDTPAAAERPAEEIQTSARNAQRAAQSRRTAKHIFITWLLGIFIAACIALPARLVDRDATLGGVTYGTWGVVMAVEVTSWPVCRVMTEIFVRITSYALRNSARLWRFVHLLQECRVQIAYALWSMLLLATFQPVIRSRPLPPWERTPQVDLWWATRILAVNFLMSLLLIWRRISLVRLSMGKRMETYAQDVRVSVLRQDILQWMTIDMPDSVLTMPSSQMRAARFGNKTPSPKSGRRSPANLLKRTKRASNADPLAASQGEAAAAAAPAGDGPHSAPTTAQHSREHSLDLTREPSRHVAVNPEPQQSANSFVPVKTEEQAKLNDAARRLQRFFRKTLADQEASNANANGEARGSKNRSEEAQRKEAEEREEAIKAFRQGRHYSGTSSNVDDEEEDEEGDQLSSPLLAAFDDVRGLPYRVCRGLSRLSSKKVGLFALAVLAAPFLLSSA